MSDESAHGGVKVVDPDGVEGKGLKAGTIGLTGATMMGLASTAPAYSLAATIGLVVGAVGVKAPSCMLFAFIPMLFTAFAYRELNNVIPDCGTVFTWATKAFGPYIGWMGGWAVAVTGIIFLGSAAQVTGQYFFQLIDKANLAYCGLPQVADCTVADGPTGTVWLSYGTMIGILFIAVMGYVAYRGLDIGAAMQLVLVTLQYVALALIAVVGLWAVYHGAGSEGSITPEWSWLSPTGIDFGTYMQGFLLCLFIYWGWDAVLAINEETKDPEKIPGRAALIATVILLVGYVSVTIACVAYAGVGDTGIGLNNPDIQDDVFYAITGPLFQPLPVIGEWGTGFVLLVVLMSTAASAMTTILPTARGTLSMSTYKALPKRFSSISPKYFTPGFSTFVTVGIGLGFYLLMTFISSNLLAATISSISLAIAFYYSLTGFACVWYFRHELFVDFRSIIFKFLLPLIGGLILAAAFIISAVQMWQPDYQVNADGSDQTIFGIGAVFVIGIGSLAVGVVLMFLWRAKESAFFKGQTLKHDTPVLAPDI